MERHERRRFFLETKSLYKKSVKVATIDALSDPVLEMLALSTVSIALLAGSYLVLNRTIFLDLGLIKLQLAVAADGDRGPALPLRHAGRHLRPGPQAGQRPLPDPARRGGRRPDLRPDGPPAPGRRQADRHPPPPPSQADRVRRGRLQLQRPRAGPPRAEPDRPPRRDDRAGRPQRLRQVDPDEPAAPVLGRPLGRDPDRRPRHPRRPAAEPPQPDRHGDPGDDPVRGHDRQQHRLRQPPRHAARRSSPLPSVRTRTSSSRPCPTATTRSSASAGSASPAASGSGSPWPAPCSATRPS